MKKTIEQRRLEFLDETVAYYSEDVNRRATNVGGSCFYLTEDGRKCAIGRYIPPKKYSSDFEGRSVKGDIFNCLPKKIKELGEVFLIKVQTFHDGDENWDENGLTMFGKEDYKNIVKEFCTQI